MKLKIWQNILMRHVFKLRLYLIKMIHLYRVKLLLFYDWNNFWHVLIWAQIISDKTLDVCLQIIRLQFNSDSFNTSWYRKTTQHYTVFKVFVPCSTWAQRAWPSSSCACSSWGWCRTSSSSSWHHHAASAPGEAWTPEHKKTVLLLLRLLEMFQHYQTVVISFSRDKTILRSPSGCCSLTACVRPPAAFQRRSTSADQEGYLQEEHRCQHSR